MKPETPSTSSGQAKSCQNCRQNFIIDSEDFNFYQKIKVPPPTFCPECRLIRRLAWRNERSLYHRTCDSCQKNIIAMYHKSVPFPVFCPECWYGDGWDASSHSLSYDMNKTFFEQYRELSRVVPRLALWQRNAINSDYSNLVGESKNVYLSISVILGSENVFYSKSIDKSTDIIDCLNIKGSQSLYENIEGEQNYNSQYLLLCRSCMDSYYLVDCINCSNCVLSFNLHHKEFFIRNQQYSKEEYFRELEKLNLKNRISRQALSREFEEIKKQAIYRFANIIKSVNSTGNNLLNVKNCRNCFDVYGAENLRYCYRAVTPFKDSMDISFGMKGELMYEYSTGSLDTYNVKFSYASTSLRNADYTDSCINCADIFGCISLKNKENAIFNKVYSKEEFKKLRDKIIRQMSDVPFVNKTGIKHVYGEFFPIELSLWAYNETLAQELAPLTKEQAMKKGYPWRELSIKNFKITIPAEKIPDNIDEIDEKIKKEVLECAHKNLCAHQCTTAFRITDYELKFYKKHQIPLPIFCSNCRYYERIKNMPSLKLWKRNCMCDKQNHFHGDKNCQTEFETAYAPNRPEIIYCEKCYQQEVY